MLQRINRAIILTDCFGSEVKLNLNGMQYYQSLLGGWVTIIFSSLMAYIVVAQSINLIERKTFYVITQDRWALDPAPSTLDQFMMGFQISQPAYIQKIEQQYLSNGTRTKTFGEMVALETCTKQHVLQTQEDNYNVNYILKKSFVFNNLNQFLCIPLNYTMQIQGTYHSNTFIYHKIVFSNITKSQTLSTFIQDVTPDLYSENNYNTTIYNDFFIDYTAGQSIQSNIFIKSTQFQVDYSLIPLQGDLISTTVHTVDKAQLSYTLATSNSWTLYIRASDQYTVGLKTFYRFDTFLSYLGGIWKFLISFIGLFVCYYNRTGLMVQLANYLYQFDIPVSKQGKMSFTYQDMYITVSRKIEVVEQVIARFKRGAHRLMTMARVSSKFHTLKSAVNEPLKGETEEEHHLSINETKKDILNSVVTSIVDSKKRVQFGIGYVLKIVIYCFRRNSDERITNKLLQQSQQMILRDLDILTILDKLQEVGKLKRILLDKNQQKVFNCLPKPVVTFVETALKHPQLDLESPAQDYNTVEQILQNQRKCLLGGRHKYDNKHQLLKLYRAYNQIRLMKERDNQLNVQTINERIISMLEPSIQLSFKEIYKLDELNAQIEAHRQHSIVLSTNRERRRRTEEDENKNDKFKWINQKHLVETEIEYE